MITITKAPPYLTVQDTGRKRSRAEGVPPGGAMDLFALRAGNALVGNATDLAGLEWALGGGSVHFDRDCVFALTGAVSEATLAGTAVAPCSATFARTGQVLSVERITSGRFLYLSFSGGIDVPLVLGSRSTYLPGKFGGAGGRSLKTGDSLALGVHSAVLPPHGFHCAADLMPHYEGGVVHVTPGTHRSIFDESAWSILTESSYRISPASDRTGYKLEGPAIVNFLGAIPSEAGCPGTIQVPADGAPICLMADAPTVGGYPKIAVVSEADLPILAQRRPGDSIRFESTTVEQSQRALKRRASDLNAIVKSATRAVRG